MPPTRIERAAVDLVTRVRRGRPDPLTSVVLTTPVFLLYHLGILWSDKRNGVDWVTELTLRLLHSSVQAYVLVTLAFAGGLSVAAFVLRKTGKVRPAALLPVAAESALWAVLLLLSVGWATAHIAPALATGARLGLGPFDRLVMAAGAGFHEELSFRVVLLSGGALFLRHALGAPAVRAWLLCALGSSFLFAFAHHVGPQGEGLTVTALCFRTLAGVFLSLLYGARGFAVAVYTHAFYDLLVFFALG
jgi:Type II CAAX prenyl endopeptidase Rce1-like